MISGFFPLQKTVSYAEKTKGSYSTLVTPNLLMSFFPDSKQLREYIIICVLITFQGIKFTIWVDLFIMVACLYCVPFSSTLFWLFVFQWKGFGI